MTMMPVRVELSYLNLIDGYYLLNGVLFNGFAYDHRDKKLYKVYQMTAGKITAEQDYGFLEKRGFIKIDFEEIKCTYDSDVSYLYQGKPFNGITYEYKNGFIWGESLFIDGYGVESVSFYPDGSGLVRAYEANYDHYRCSFEWQYKQLIDVQVTKEPYTVDQSVSCKINDNNKIAVCVLSGDNVTKFGSLVTRTDLPLTVNTLEDLLATHGLADKLRIFINNDVNFNFFVEHAAFNNIKAVEIPTKGISLAALTQFIEVPHLQSLWFDDRSFSQDEFNKLDASQRLSKQQQLDERNHALLALLLTIQAKRHCDIRLDTSSAGADLLIILSFNQAGETKLIIDASENDFNYLLNTLPLANITELDLRQKQLPITTLYKLIQFSQLKKISIEEKDILDLDLAELESNVKAVTQQQCHARHQTLWLLLQNLQTQLHCDIKLTSYSGASFEKKYGTNSM